MEYAYLGATSNPSFSAYTNGSSSSESQYSGDIPSGGSVHISITGDCYGGETVIVDPNNLIEESNENNNIATIPSEGNSLTVAGSQPW